MTVNGVSFLCVFETGGKKDIYRKSVPEGIAFLAFQLGESAIIAIGQDRKGFYEGDHRKILDYLQDQGFVSKKNPNIIGGGHWRGRGHLSWDSSLVKDVLRISGRELKERVEELLFSEGEEIKKGFYFLR